MGHARLRATLVASGIVDGASSGVKAGRSCAGDGPRLTYVREGLVLLHKLDVSLQQGFLHLVKVVLKLLHPLLKVVNLLLALG